MGQPTTAPLPAHLVLFDGECGLCNRSVRWLLARDRERVLTFAPLDGVTGRAVVERHAPLRDVDSLVYVRTDASGERVFTHGQGVWRCARLLPRPWSWLGLIGIVPAPLLDAGYRLLAAHRYRIWGRAQACDLPSTEWRERFLP